MVRKLGEPSSVKDEGALVGGKLTGATFAATTRLEDDAERATTCDLADLLAASLETLLHLQKGLPLPTRPSIFITAPA